MEKDKNQNQDQSQGKQGTAETDVSYNQDTEELRNSATTSQGYATSSSSIGSGGGRTAERPETPENIESDK